MRKHGQRSHVVATVCTRQHHAPPSSLLLLLQGDARRLVIVAVHVHTAPFSRFSNLPRVSFITYLVLLHRRPWRAVAATVTAATAAAAAAAASASNAAAAPNLARLRSLVPTHVLFTNSKTTHVRGCALGWKGMWPEERKVVAVCAGLACDGREGRNRAVAQAVVLPWLIIYYFFFCEMAFR